MEQEEGEGEGEGRAPAARQDGAMLYAATKLLTCSKTSYN